MRLGPDIEVGAVTMLDPTTARVDLAIGPTAAVGPRDVTVSSGGRVVTLGYTVAPSLAATVTGEAAQGGAVRIDLTSLVDGDEPGIAPFWLGQDLRALPEDPTEDFDRTQVLIAPGAAPGPRALVMTDALGRTEFATGPDGGAVPRIRPRDGR